MGSEQARGRNITEAFKEKLGIATPNSIGHQENSTAGSQIVEMGVWGDLDCRVLGVQLLNGSFGTFQCTRVEAENIWSNLEV